MKWYTNDASMTETLEPTGSLIEYRDHIEALVECERLAKKCYLEQSDSHWKIEYDRLIEKYGHLFIGTV